MRTLYARFPEKWPEGEATEIEWTLKGGKPPQESGKSSSIAMLPRAPRIFAVLPYQAVSIVEMELPPSRADLLQKVAMNAVGEVSISGGGSAHVAVGSETSKGKRAVAVTGKGLMRAVIEGLSKSGRKPDGVIIDAMSLPLEQGAFSLIWNGREGFLKVSESMGFSLDSAQEDEPPACLARALEFCAGTGEVVSRVDIYLEPGAEPPPLSEWGGKLGIPLQAVKEWDWREPAAMADANTLNLMQGEFAPPSVLETMYPSMKISAALIAGLILAWTGGVVAEWRALKREESALRGSVRDIFVTAFPKAGPALDPLAQMRKAISDMKGRSNVWSDGNFTQLAEMAGQCLQGSHIVSMEYEGRKMEIVAVMSGDDEVKKSLAKMASLGLDGAVKGKSKADGGVRAEFVIGMAVRKEGKDGNVRENKAPFGS